MVSVSATAGELALRIHRVLRPVTGDGAAPGAVSATWDSPTAPGLAASSPPRPTSRSPDAL